MSKITTLLFVFFSLLASAQQEASIQHYQRAWAADTIHLPCEKWDTKDLLINVPDSLYKSGSITVKKMRYNGVKGFGYNVEIKNGKVYKVVISGKGKERQEVLLALDVYIRTKYIAERSCKSKAYYQLKRQTASLTIEASFDAR